MQVGSLTVAIESAASAQLGSLTAGAFYAQSGQIGSLTATGLSGLSMMMGDMYGFVGFDGPNLWFSMTGKGGGKFANINAANGAISARSGYFPSLTVGTYAYIEDSEQYNAYIWNLSAVEFAAESAQAGSLNMTVASAASLYAASLGVGITNRARLPTPLYSSGMSLFCTINTIASMPILPAAGYSALIPMYAAYTYSAGATNAEIALSAHLNDGTALRLAYYTNANGIESLGYAPLMASIGTQTGKYVAAVVWWLRGYTLSSATVWNGDIRCWMV